uniref:PDEase domain-containing protein n=1 Tax=Ascaris lumbricoides TaxID=6252 RepID=A0A0M3I4P6_ASCLU
MLNSCCFHCLEQRFVASPEVTLKNVDEFQFRMSLPEILVLATLLVKVQFLCEEVWRHIPNYRKSVVDSVMATGVVHFDYH